MPVCAINVYVSPLGPIVTLGEGLYVFSLTEGILREIERKIIPNSSESLTRSG